MSQYVESMLPSMGLTTDATGNIVPAPEPGAAKAASAPAPAPVPTSAPAAEAVPAVKATTPQADVPEPPQMGQDNPADTAVLKKKTLLGG